MLCSAGKRRYNIKLWKTFTDCFNCLPIAAIGIISSLPTNFRTIWTICNQYPIQGQINPKTKTMKIRSLVLSTLSFNRFCTFPFMCLYFVSYSAALPFLLIFLHGISGFGQCSNVFLWMTTIQCIVNDKAALKHPRDLNFSAQIIQGIFCTSFRNCIPSNNSDRKGFPGLKHIQSFSF